MKIKNGNAFDFAKNKIIYEQMLKISHMSFYYYPNFRYDSHALENAFLMRK
jgi:hypothetical protein